MHKSTKHTYSIVRLLTSGRFLAATMNVCKEVVMQKIIPNLWCNNNAQEMVDFYLNIFDNAKMVRTDFYTEAGKEQHGHAAGEVMSITFELENFTFIAINGGSNFQITPAVSFFVRCDSVDAIDSLWEALSDNATVLMPLEEYSFSKWYGWIQDKFGVSWQLILSDEIVSQKIVPSLLFTGEVCGRAEEAMRYYAGIFPNSQVGVISPYPADMEPDKQGAVAHGEFTLCGQQFTAMDSARNPELQFSEAVSFLVECEDQAEIDTYWSALSVDPDAEICGWLKDKYGVSWQIAPRILNDMYENGSPEQIERVTGAFMRMKKLDIKALEKAYQK